MKKIILKWQERFLVQHLPNKSVILVDNNEEKLFDSSSFPLLHLIDGKRTVGDIMEQQDDQGQIESFLSCCAFLLEEGIYLSTDAPREEGKTNRILVSENNILIYFPPNSYQPVNLSICSDINVQILITDNVLDKCLSNSVATYGPINPRLIVIELSNHKCLISPLLSSQTELKRFQQALLSNRPVLQFLQCYNNGDNEDISSCFSSNLTNEGLQQYIHQVFDKVISLYQHQELENNAVEYHYKTKLQISHPLQYLAHSAHKESLQPFHLTSRKVTFDKDGGSRCVQAQKTVETILPFVSPKTGLITHIEELSQTKKNIIKIYKTAFFKQLQLKDVDQLNNNSFVQACMGKGVSHAQSMASALCEAIERKNAQFTGLTPSKCCVSDELDYPHFLFQSIAPYSAKQYADFRTNTVQSLTNVIPYNDEPIHWCSAWSLTNQCKVYIPYVLCFANTPYTDDKFGKWQSNGCAAGNNLEEAILQALFELIERDAVSIWWYNKLPRPSFDLRKITPEYYQPLHNSISITHDYWVLDLTFDTGIPVMAAIGRDKETDGWVFGFGCHLKPEMAAQRALTELCQLIPIRNQNGAPFDFDAIAESSDFLQPNNDCKSIPATIKSSGDLKLDILAVVEQLKSLELETLVFDYSRDPIPIKTAKVFVPGLCHIWPQLGNQRLYNVPVKLGMRPAPLTETTINQQELYI
ncbi:hypothetical protein A7985_05230 [Pseudoalteromonas luteoviolacea]|uniref:YcaO domain-containing protein n=1 Tax=Pseudoalteromonas luteoviolacea TaxID=43657 RepID=A0A1C0TVJ7_9GAMM|nr:YcaO-like family protein [Pseudoalteromonas luteoviolacea]OCQ23348.1 hypothetical protein A7985_05230 [Pseudoalteromonas luteoviolacea]